LIAPTSSIYASRLKAKFPGKMGYPDTFEGFMVNDHKDWAIFKKQEVC
jgi:hypothetical protein